MKRPSASTSKSARSVLSPVHIQPEPSPVGKVTAGSLFQRAKQVAERRIAERVGAEVIAQARQEVLQPDVGHQLLEHTGALGAGDPVEVDLDGELQ